MNFSNSIAKASSFRVINSVEELLDLHDEEFIHAAFLCVLGRNPDPEGLTYYLKRIRSGVGKQEILGQIALSSEGLQNRPTLPGLPKVISAERRSSADITSAGPLTCPCDRLRIEFVLKAKSILVDCCNWRTLSRVSGS